jgi:hypothetical protein
VQLFSRAGRLVGELRPDLVGKPELNGMRAGRISYESGLLIAPKGGYDDISQRRDQVIQWDLMAHAANHSRPLLSLRMPPLPLVSRVPFTGPEQARPVWDVRGGCVAASDGTGGWMVRTSLAGARPDTVRLDLSGVKPPELDRDEIARLMGMTDKGQGGGYVGPTELKRLSALVIDPDGYAWLLPWQDSTNVSGGGVEVVRVSLATGRAERDTVPEFPAAFGAPGVFYTRSYDRHAEEAVVRRYDLSPGRKPGAR